MVYLWMFAAVLVAGPVTGWWLGGRLAGKALRWRVAAGVGLLGLGMLWPIELRSEWSLAVPGGEIWGYLAAVFGYLAATSLFWGLGRDGVDDPIERSRERAVERMVGRGLSVALVAPLVVAIVRAGVGLLLVVAFIVGNASEKTISQGRVSPTVSYVVRHDQALVGGAEFAQYQIYRNPAWFPLVHRRVWAGAADCWSEGVEVMFRAGKDAETLEMVCVSASVESKPEVVTWR